LQVRLAGIETLAVLGLRANADVHVRIGLVVMQDQDVLVIGELGLGELARRAQHAQRVGASGHRQDDVERFSAVADVVDQRPAIAPVLGELAYCLPSPRDLAVLILDVEAAVLADVAKVGGNRLHAPATARHLDHDLGRAADDCGIDPRSDEGGSPRQAAGQPRRWRDLTIRLCG
jgi:hypothetical protein